MLKALPFILIVALVIYTVVDIANSEEDERLGVPQILWILLVVLIPVLGCIAWFAVSRTRRAQRAAGATSAPARGTTGPVPNRRPDRPLAPDDDPEFLWLLEQARLKKEREQRAAQESDGNEHVDPPEGEAPRA